MEALARQIQSYVYERQLGVTRSIARGPDMRAVHLYPHSDDTSRGRSRSRGREGRRSVVITVVGGGTDLAVELYRGTKKAVIIFRTVRAEDKADKTWRKSWKERRRRQRRPWWRRGRPTAGEMTPCWAAAMGTSSVAVVGLPTFGSHQRAPACGSLILPWVYDRSGLGGKTLSGTHHAVLRELHGAIFADFFVEAGGNVPPRATCSWVSPLCSLALAPAMQQSASGRRWPFKQARQPSRGCSRADPCEDTLCPRVTRLQDR